MDLFFDAVAWVAACTNLLHELVVGSVSKVEMD